MKTPTGAASLLRKTRRRPMIRAPPCSAPRSIISVALFIGEWNEPET